MQHLANVNCHKKTTLIWVGLFLLVLASVTAQVVDISEVKGDSITYIKEETKNSVFIRNKCNTLRVADAYFLEYAEYGGNFLKLQLVIKQNWICIYGCSLHLTIKMSESNLKDIAL